MKELLRLDCIVADYDSISFHQDKMYPEEVEIRIENCYDENAMAVVLGKKQVKEVINTLLEIL